MRQNAVAHHDHPAMGHRRKKLLQGHHHIAIGLVEVGVAPEDVKLLMSIIQPYLASFHEHLLRPETVNGEQDARTEFTVNGSDEQEDM
jgi:hypothetical protein